MSIKDWFCYILNSQQEIESLLFKNKKTTNLLLRENRGSMCNYQGHLKNSHSNSFIEYKPIITLIICV